MNSIIEFREMLLNIRRFEKLGDPFFEGWRSCLDTVVMDFNDRFPDYKILLQENEHGDETRTTETEADAHAEKEGLLNGT